MDQPSTGAAHNVSQWHTMVDKEGITRDWVTIQSPLLMTTVLLSYACVLVVGPRIMASRKPFEFMNLIRFYNLVQIACSFYLGTKVFRIPGAVEYLVKHSCTPDDPDNITQMRQEYLYASWQMFMLKIFDLLDTCFVVLRKKQSQISFLHVYHHATLVFLTWWTIKYYQAQQAAFPMILNMFVHVVMYTYYFLSTFGPSVQKYIWWKKYVTIIQMVQFWLDFVYLAALVAYGCEVSQSFNVYGIFQAGFFSFLFADFYFKNYRRKEEVSSGDSDNAAGTRHLKSS